MMISQPHARSPSRQRGVVLIFTLIVLLILTIGAVGLMRSMNNSLFSAGNLAFRRDLVNQGETAVSFVLGEFSNGGALSTSAVTVADLQSANYSAQMLPQNSQGVPNQLLVNDLNFTAGLTANDITGATPDVKIRYVIERMCNAGGLVTSANCVQSTAAPLSNSLLDKGVAPPTATVYRLSVRVSQTARNTQVFLQTSFTRPD